MLDQAQISVSLSFSHWPQQLPPKVKIVQREQKIPLRPVVTKKVVHVGEGQNQETTDTRGYGVKALFHFIHWCHQLPEQPY